MKQSSAPKPIINLGSVSTYQSGVVQASAHRLLNREMSTYLEPYGLTCMQWFMIGLIYDAGDLGIRMTDLMRKLDTTLPFITNSLNLLESKKIVQKKAHATDSRTKLVSIHPLYRPQVQEIEIYLRNKLRGLLYSNDNISPDELGVYIGVLYKMTLFGKS